MDNGQAARGKAYDILEELSLCLKELELAGFRVHRMPINTTEDWVEGPTVISLDGSRGFSVFVKRRTLDVWYAYTAVGRGGCSDKVSSVAELEEALRSAIEDWSKE